MAAFFNVFEHCKAVALESGDGVIVIGIAHIEKVMDDFGLIGSRRLRGTDIHPAVDLHRINGDEFDIGAATRQRHRQRGLPRSSRTYKREVSTARTKPWRRTHPAVTAKRVR